MACRNWDPPEPRSRDRGGAACALLGNARRGCTRRSPVSGAHRYHSRSAVASRHDTAAATKRRPRPSLGAAHRSSGPTLHGGGSGQCLGRGRWVGAPGGRGEEKALKCAGSPAATSSNAARETIRLHSRVPAEPCGSPK